MGGNSVEEYTALIFGFTVAAAVEVVFSALNLLVNIKIRVWAATVASYDQQLADFQVHIL